MRDVKVKPMENRVVLSQVKEVRETKDVKEVAQMLASGDWIAIYATPQDPFCFCLGRVC